MVAFQFPPFAGSSAIQRTLRFTQQLPRYGWEPVVLSATPGAYESTSEDLLVSVPAQLAVHRAFAFDTARHLAWRGRYPGFLARPDRWTSWRFDAVRVGRAMIRRYQPAAIWSTFPIATAHVVGQRLHAGSGLPWIADFRDPMAQDGYPADPKTWRSFKDIETRVLADARFSVFTTPGAARAYQARYARVAAERIRVIENGYDEDTFAAVERDRSSLSPLTPGVITLLHSGVVYSSERDPTCLFDALAVLKRDAARALPAFRIRFRASGNDALLREMAEHRGVADLIEVLPPIPYAEAIREMMSAEGLVVMQASNCNQQIPAKLYEYLRAGRPVIGLTDPAGDTAGVLRAAGLPLVAPLDSAAEIARLLEAALRQIAVGSAVSAAPDYIRVCAREARTEALAKLIDEACA
jgi:glycosyltransferase involved in cell wall biosynthesis